MSERAINKSVLDEELTEFGSSSSPWNSNRVRVLRGFLQFVGGVTLLAFGAALMPSDWFGWWCDKLGLEGFPERPVAYYLARHLSLLYGFVGVGLLVVATDLDRYYPLIRPMGWGTVVFGTLQLVVDAQASMPAWWTLGEGISTIIGGLTILTLRRWAI